jgi:hypothetical protein
MSYIVILMSSQTIYSINYGINYYKLAVEKDCDSIFTTITWKPGQAIVTATTT